MFFVKKKVLLYCVKIINENLKLSYEFRFIKTCGRVGYLTGVWESGLFDWRAEEWVI